MAKLEDDITMISQNLGLPNVRDSVGNIRMKIDSLISDSEKGKQTIEDACKVQEKRQVDVDAYKQFLDDTEIWLQSVVLAVDENHSINDCKVKNVLQYL